MRGVLAIYFTLFGAAFATVFFKETFDDGWRNRWVESTHKGSDAGKWLWSAGEFYGDAEADKGIKTQDDAKFYALSAKHEKFSNEGKTLFIQFTVKHEQNIDCGGGYVKLFPSALNQKDMHGDSPYNIMFGPDICGPGTKKVHVIFSYKGKNHLVKKEIRCKDDVFSHLYTLIVRPDQTYEVRIDDAKVESGSLEEDWDFLPPKMIKDPNAKKPEDWDEREKIDDADDKKPDDWDKPQHIPDPAATKPEDWDDEMDGEWEPPQIDNPEYKGEWKARQIDNPAYKGKWIHPEIDNPEYSADSKIYAYDDFGVIGFDLWQVKAGTIFDDVIIADDESEIKELAQVWKRRNEAETKAKELKDEEQRKKEEEERKKEEEAKKDEAGKKEEKDDEDAEEDKSAEATEPEAEAHDHDHDEHDHDHAHDHTEL